MSTIKEISEQAVKQAQPLVSVAMITYNHAEFIAQAIEGVAMQKTLFPIELVIGVDCSQDNTLEIAARYQKAFPHLIRLLVPKQRLGMHGNFFVTLESCRGKYIAICEADDYWTKPEKLSTQIDFLERHPHVAGTFHDCYILDQERGTEELRVGNRSVDPDPNIASVIVENNISTASMVFRNLFASANWKPWLSKTPKCDYMLALLVARIGPWHYFTEPMSVYRVHAGGIWSGLARAMQYQQNVDFWELLSRSPEYSALVALIKARLRRDRRFLSVALAREGKLLRSIVEFTMSIGPVGGMGGRIMPASKYWRTLLASVGLGIGLRRTTCNPKEAAS